MVALQQRAVRLDGDAEAGVLGLLALVRALRARRLVGADSGVLQMNAEIGEAVADTHGHSAISGASSLRRPWLRAIST